MSQSSEISWLSEKQRLACFHLESEQPGFGGVRRRQPVVEDDREHSLNKTPLHSSTPIAGAGSKDWRKNFASSPESDCSNNNGDWSLGGDSGYGGLDSSRIGGSLPFPKKPSSWWRPLLRRVLGRPSFLEPEMAPRWLRLHPQQMIALVLTAALLACIGFSSVLLFRHMPIPRNPNPSRDVIDQEMMGEFYDDPFEGMQQIPFEGMEQIFGMQDGSENVLDRNEQIEEEIETEEGEKLEEVQDTVEQMMNANLEKKKVLLTKIKSFGLPTAPVDNLLGRANKTEDKTNLESPKNTDSLPDSKSEASVEAEGGQAIAKEPNGRIGLGGKKGAANASEGDIKQKSKRTKAVNPLVKKRRKKTSKAKKAKEL